MNLLATRASTILCWSAATILAVLPVLMAVDFGGVLHWSQWIAGVAILLAAIFAFAAQAMGWKWQTTEDTLVDPKSYWLVGLVFGWAIFAWLQTISLPAGLVRWLSPASYDIYSAWTVPFQAPRTWFPISIAPADSAHAIAMLVLIASVAWTSLIIFNSRQRVGLLLIAIAAGGAVTALIGIVRVMYPEFHLWSFRDESGTYPFGTFINRNNAALFMNLGVATSLGVLAWRMSAVHDQEVDVHGFRISDLFSLFGDRDSMIAMICGLVCIVGVLVCGSRAGVLALLVGGFCAFGWIRQRRGRVIIPVLVLTGAIALIVAILPMNVTSITIERFESTLARPDALAGGRIKHWPDGLRAAYAHLPVGSGLSTYAYAYLPFQNSSPEAWYHHADNLWLELLVEQGLIGVALTIAIFTLVVIALLKMAYAHDPMDEGIRITGWYCVGTILASQLFDFGLIIPANLLIVAVLVPIVLARGNAVPRFKKDLDPQTPLPMTDDKVMVGRSADTGPNVSLLQPEFMIKPASIGACVLLFSLFAVGQLRGDAHNQFLVRSYHHQFDTIKTDADALQQAIEQLQAANQSHPCAELCQVLADYQFQYARLQEVAALRPTSPEQANDWYQQTSRTVRRLKWRSGDQWPADRDPNSAAGRYYQASLQSEDQSLLYRPLALEPRVAQVYLEFIHQDLEHSREAIIQSKTLYWNNHLLLLSLASIASENKDLSLATSLWHRAITLNPERTEGVIKQALRHPEIDLSDVVPDQDTNYWRAASYLTTNKIQSPKLYQRMFQQLACAEYEDMIKRANCEQLLADVALQLGKHEAALLLYREAIKSDPMTASRRWKLVQAYETAGRIDDAVKYARTASEIFPTDKRLKEFLRQNAN